MRRIFLANIRGRSYKLTLLLLLLSVMFEAHALTSQTIEILDEEFQVDLYRANGDELILFISAGIGLPERVYQVSTGVSKLGIELWHVDLAENLFLPNTASTFRALDGRFVAALIEKAHALTGKNITLMSHAYAAMPTLRGLRTWQLKNATQFQKSTSNYLNGLILLSPDLYIHVPDLGLNPVFSPISSATNVPVMIFQSGRRGNRWQLEKVIDELQKGGAQVYSKVFPGVTGIFYGEDVALETLALLKSMPSEIELASKILSRILTPPIPPPLSKKVVGSSGHLDMTLKPFKGNPQPPHLNLFSVHGERVIHKTYTGKVTIVNFWATWCGPCIEEIPSLNRLREQMKGLPFELISIDYAEEKSDILNFMEDVNVDFPVLLDSDGKVSAQWNVLVFPSTFVIAPNGKIVYGVKGGIHWDTPEVVTAIKGLIDSK